MAQPSATAGTIILTGNTDFTKWWKQLRARYQPSEIWSIIDPTGNTQPLSKPVLPLPPSITNYEVRTPQSTQRGRPPHRDRDVQEEEDEGESSAPILPSTPVPSKPSDLTVNGLKAYNSDYDFYKGQLEHYKILDRKHEQQRNELKQVVIHIQTTVTPFLQSTCCLPEHTVRDWITALQAAAGVDPDDERIKARARYQKALIPMKASTSWTTWLDEYNQAATEAEVLAVPKLHD